MDERSIGAMPWVSVAGPRAECFRALGRHAAQAISSIVDSLPQLEALRRQVATAGGRSRFEAVVAATAARFPTHMDEMTALAEGAGVEVGTVLLLNLRGDLGDPQAGSCSDVAVPGEGWVLGHNEDGDPQFAPVLSGLTLHVDGDPPAFALWYPGMLPSNAFTLNGGLAWGIDHIPAVASTAGPARHVVARALQCLQELETAIDFLASVPSAGGFAYNFVEPSSGRVATVEAGGGAGARPQVPGAAPILWHTNHVRYTAASGAEPGRSSCARGEVLAAVAEREWRPPLDRDAILDVLTTPLPDGVRAEGQSVTLCTVVVDGPSQTITFVPRGGEPVHLSIDELLR